MDKIPIADACANTSEFKEHFQKKRVVFTLTIQREPGFQFLGKSALYEEISYWNKKCSLKPTITMIVDFSSV